MVIQSYCIVNVLAYHHLKLSVFLHQELIVEYYHHAYGILADGAFQDDIVHYPFVVLALQSRMVAIDPKSLLNVMRLFFDYRPIVAFGTVVDELAELVPKH